MAKKTMIFFTDSTVEMEKEKLHAKKKGYHFHSFPAKKWEMLKKTLLPIMKENAKSNIIHLPIGQNQLSSIDKVEEKVIRNALTVCNGNVSKTAQFLQISRATLYRKADRFGLKMNNLREVESIQKKVA